MKDKIFAFIIGLLIGAIITASVFLVINKNKSNENLADQNAQGTTQENRQGPGGMPPDGEMPDGEPPAKPDGEEGEEPPAKPDGEEDKEPPTKSGENTKNTSENTTETENE